MKKITKTYEVYEFEELSKEAQEKVLEDFRFFEVENDWYWSLFEDFERQLSDIGIEVRKETVYQGAFSFDLDRGRYFYINSGSITDVDKFWEFLGWEKTGNEYEEAQENGLALITKQYGGGTAKTYVGLGWSEHTGMTERLNGLLEEFLRSLGDEYDYLTSDECIKEIIKSNEYVFLESGEQFFN